jgi:hypothetical protein
MTEPDPFAPEALAPTLTARQPPVLPLHLVGVALLMSVVSIAVTLIGLLMAGLGVYWLANVYMERHRLASCRQPAGLLIGYGLAYLLLSWALGFASGPLYVWLYQQLDVYGTVRLLFGFGWWGIGLLIFCLEALLPLWLLLQLFRHQAEGR